MVAVFRLFYSIAISIKLTKINGFLCVNIQGGNPCHLDECCKIKWVYLYIDDCKY